jgi:50S ribosomal protein L16 3-hydroxylase
MLAQWLAPLPVASFVGAHLHKQPLAGAGSAAGTVPAFGWDTLGRVLAAQPPPDLLAVGRGKLADVPPPRTVAAARALMATGIGFVIRRADRQDPGLAALAAAFARDLPGEVHIQLFVTPAATHSFGWHYDFEDVFIVQTHGAKDYFFRENTIDRATPRDARPDFTLVRREVSPMATARLLPGDWLYVPARWWHVAVCIEESLSISVGAFPTVR